MIFVLIGIVVAGVAADQITKLLAVKYLSDIATKPLIDGVFHFTYLENKGAAFGSFSDRRWVFMILSCVAIVALAVYLFGFSKDGKFLKTAMALIISGGIGNMIDRFALGYVVDFIDVRLINFYIFNIADSLVCVGCGMVIFALVRGEIKNYREKKNAGK